MQNHVILFCILRNWWTFSKEEGEYWKKKCLYLFLLCSRCLRFLSKKSLNSDGQQLHKYQQYEQPTLTSNHWTQNDHDIWNPVPGLGRTQTCGKIKLVMDVLHHFYYYFNYVVVIWFYWWRKLLTYCKSLPNLIT